MKLKKFDSVVFGARDLAATRKFYREVLGLQVGRYMKDGVETVDENESYVNFDCGGVTLGFEKSEEATVVLLVEDLAAALAELKQKGARIAKEHPAFVIVLDPDGREIILQQQAVV